jgi:neopullulanase
MTHYIQGNNVSVYSGYTEQKTVMMVINNSTAVETLKTNRFQENIKDSIMGKDLLTGK